jgi:hypothetical protein
MWRRLLLVLAVPFFAACGATSTPANVAVETLELDWRERDVGIDVEVRRLMLRRNGWSAELAFTNGTGQTLVIDRAHVPGGTRFGLLVLATGEWDEVRRLTTGGRLPPPAETATRFDPPLPRVVRPGRRWRGTMSGNRPLARGRFVRILLGRFNSQRPVRGGVRRFLLITEHSVRLEDCAH